MKRKEGDGEVGWGRRLVRGEKGSEWGGRWRGGDEKGSEWGKGIGGG